MMIEIEEIKRIEAIHEKGKRDRLVAFLLNGEPGLLEIERIRERNLALLFEEARKFKVRYLYVGKGEICGCEGKSQPGDVWPAMWAIAKNIGFAASCGNSDQYQCQESQIAFPSESYGGWDLKTKTKLSDEETEKKKFARVVTRKW